MKIIRYAQGETAVYGVLEDDGTIRELLGSPFAVFDAGRAVAHVDEVRVLAPVAPSKCLGVGANYTTHTTAEPPPFPFFFFKPPSAVIGPEESIVHPSISAQVDYEGELTVIIGKLARSSPLGLIRQT